MVEIVEPRAEWPREYARFAAILRAGLGPLAVRIDPIGSTAVPGLAAKDVIDIQVTVASLDDSVAAAIAGLGFVRYPGVDRDHVPPGALRDDAEWRKLLFVEPAGERRVHLHVRQCGRANQRYALLFRDYLIARPAAAAAYAELKRRLAANLADPRTYPDVKDPAVDLIYLAAEEWAERVGWRDGERIAAPEATPNRKPASDPAEARP